jgi:branched-subunit amino acid aminotransferase/4-amino-4-deoxychorismate lyase
MADTFVWENGALSAIGAHPSMTAASRTLPHGSYTTLRTYDGRRVLRLEQHVARLCESLDPPAPGALTLPEARGALLAALDATRHLESRARLTLAPPRLFVTVERFAPLPARCYADGVACVSVPVRRRNPHAKDTDFIATAAATHATLPPGVEEGLMTADDGALLEGLSSNLFAIIGGTLRTEGERVLHGVTRSLVLEVARGLLPVETRAPAIAELGSFQEAFLTSVSREILPVVTIDGRAVGDGRPGPLTRRLIDAFAALVAREARPLDAV